MMQIVSAGVMVYSLNTALEFSSSIEAGANDSFKWFDFYTQSLFCSHSGSLYSEKRRC